MASLSLLSIFGLLPVACLAVVTIQDPSDVIPPSAWAADNAIVPDYNVPFIATQPSPIQAAYTYDSRKKSVSVDHQSYTVNKNDTSVILVTDGAKFDASYIDVLKYGYSSNLLTASFYGFNAAVNVANGSEATLKNVNITVHNGAANIYSYGTGTVVHVDNAWLYSSGPVSHGLYASGNGTIIAHNVQQFSGGMRSSSFSGDSPVGDVYVYNSVAHAAGVGSATFYALGTIYAENVQSISEKGPVVFMDGAQNATLINCDSTAGLLGGVAIFSSQIRTSGASLKLKNSRITTLGKTMPGLWFGNTIINVDIDTTEINTQSGVLVTANYSQITQDFDYYAGYADNNNLLPALVYATVSESKLKGDLVAYNGSYISWKLQDHTSWTGAAYDGASAGKAGTFDVALDSSSNWTLTKDTKVQNFTDGDRTLGNIQSAGFTLYYNASAGQSKWLGGKTVKLNGGGVAKPL
ncbi:hypothetical protein QBC46DRAFT_358521 [Diplogelasinospora grovesii]|uniref:Uncharacterized protein n=1 Tax=Diplogelasinospora grovesii TaxID=303347 RepID=A0AAN6N087_9PEZI|nr:hypothetical protein QBC46DRAFT_358521 [Diplogelasinospora grovesii]